MIAHEYANLFPMLSDSELQTLAADIKENGLQTPISTLDGKILDGRNRYRACEIAEVDPTMEEYLGGDPLGFVISHNLHRRHLSESQRGMVAAKLANLDHGSNRHTLDPSIDGSKITQSQAQDLLNVGESTVTRAKKVQRLGTPELQAAVESGEISIGSAHKVAELSHDEQREVVAAGPDAVKARAKEIREGGKHQEPETVVVDETKRPLKIVHEDGMGIYAAARSVMERINSKDLNREEALKAMIAYCQERINNQK